MVICTTPLYGRDEYDKDTSLTIQKHEKNKVISYLAQCTALVDVSDMYGTLHMKIVYQIEVEQNIF